MLLPILTSVAAAAGLLGFVVSRKPSAFRIERSIEIAAPAQKAFDYVNDFRKWAHWSPYENLDPSMTKTYGGTERGEGATYAWSGNNKAGQGTMTILKSESPGAIRIRLQFEKPFPADNTSMFDFTPSGNGTRVVWAMEGNYGFVARAMGVFVNMDKLVGGAFEQGLATLKTLAEKS